MLFFLRKLFENENVIHENEGVNTKKERERERERETGFRICDQTQVRVKRDFQDNDRSSRATAVLPAHRATSQPGAGQGGKKVN